MIALAWCAAISLLSYSWAKRLFTSGPPSSAKRTGGTPSAFLPSSGSELFPAPASAKRRPSYLWISTSTTWGGGRARFVLADDLADDAGHAAAWPIHRPGLRPARQHGGVVVELELAVQSLHLVLGNHGRGGLSGRYRIHALAYRVQQRHSLCCK